jgi:hypothetical protein
MATFLCERCKRIFYQETENKRKICDRCKKVPLVKGYSHLPKFLRLAYLRATNNTCQVCKKNKDLVLEVHHILRRSQHGTDIPDNLITLCDKCHSQVHAGKVKCQKIKTGNTFVSSGVLNSIMKELYNIIETDVSISKTYGYITDAYRKNLELEKTHCGDASIIAFCDEDSA